VCRLCDTDIFFIIVLDNACVFWKAGLVGTDRGYEATEIIEHGIRKVRREMFNETSMCLRCAHELRRVRGGVWGEIHCCSWNQIGNWTGIEDGKSLFSCESI